jgi:tellurite resistance protein
MATHSNYDTLDKDIRKVDGPLQYLPVGLFGATVAISGLAIAFKQSAALFGLPLILGTVTAFIGWGAFLLLTICYAIKYVLYPKKVKAELTHPIQANFLGTFFISAVLLAGLAAPFSLLLARVTWIAGTVGGLIFMYTLTSRLFRGDLNVLDAVPPTLIPGLTVLNAASAGVAMKFGWFGNEVDTIMFSLGIAYVFTFFVIIAYRLVHRGPVRQFLVPTLLLMSAPFTVSFICYMTRVKVVDTFGAVIFYFGFFIYFVLFFSVFKKGLPFPPKPSAPKFVDP